MEQQFKEWVEFIVSDYEIPNPLTNDWIAGELNALNKNDGYNLFMLWGFCYRDLRKHDLHQLDKNLLLKVPFNTNTLWPKYLPKGFDPEAIINSKPLSYGFREVHKQGITGKGILVAVVDFPSNMNHQEVCKQVKEYIILDEKYNVSHFHGLAVLSHLCGKTIGIAPDVDVIFYGGQPYGGSTKEEKHNIVGSYGINCLKDIKKQILNGKPIRIVNMSNSWLYYGSDELKHEASQLRNELESLGCVVIDSPKFFENYRYLDCKADEDYQNIDNYQIPPFFDVDEKNRMNFLSGGTLCASYLTTNGYEFSPVGSASYTIPQLVGFYSLALQIKPQLTFNEFVSICQENALVNKANIKVVDPIKTLERIKNGNK